MLPPPNSAAERLLWLLDAETARLSACIAALSAKPGAGEATDWLAVASLTHALLENGERHLARAVAKAWSSHQPSSCLAHCYAAAAALSLGVRAEAKRAAQQALQLEPDNQHAKSYLAAASTKAPKGAGGGPSKVPALGAAAAQRAALKQLTQRERAHRAAVDAFTPQLAKSTEQAEGRRALAEAFSPTAFAALEQLPTAEQQAVMELAATIDPPGFYGVLSAAIDLGCGKRSVEETEALCQARLAERPEALRWELLRVRCLFMKGNPKAAADLLKSVKRRGTPDVQLDAAAMAAELLRAAGPE